MFKNYKKDILSQIVDGGTYGSPYENQTVKFQYANTIAKAAGSTTAGAITFAADTNGNGAIYVQGTRVSSAIQKVAWDDQTGANHGGKTITVTWVSDGSGNEGEEGYVAAGSIVTGTFNVIDEAGLEAYFTDSSTIALDLTTKKYEVRLVENGGLKVGENGGLEVELGDVVNVDGTTIVANDETDPDTHEIINKGVLSTALAIKYVAGTPETSEGAGDGTKARIALFDKNGGTGANELSAVEVEDVIGSGIVKSTSYNEATGILTITWESEPPTTTEIDLSKLLDVLNDVVIDSSSANYMTATADVSIMKLGLTEKSRNAIDAAETAIQTINSANEYLTVGEKTGLADNKSVQLTVEADDLTITPGDIATGVDTSIAGNANKLAKSDNVATIVQTFVNARIAEEVAKLDSSAATADLSTTPNAEVYVKVTGELVNGMFDASNGLTVSTLIGDSSVTAYVKADPSTDPATEAVDPSITFTAGLATNKDLENLVSYTNDKVKQLEDALSEGTEALDASIKFNDASNYIKFGFEQNDGQVENEWGEFTYGVFGRVTRGADNTTTFASATYGLSTVESTQEFVKDIVQDLDLSNEAVDSSAVDTSNFIKTVISETDGIVKNERVEVTYATITAEPGNVTVATNGVVKGDVLAKSINDALTWTIL